MTGHDNYGLLEGMTDLITLYNQKDNWQSLTQIKKRLRPRFVRDPVNQSLPQTPLKYPADPFSAYFKPLDDVMMS